MTIKDNPFYILNASPRDSKQILHEKSEDKAFELPEEICRNAERILLNPKKRIEAEISWFPGVAPKKVIEITSQIVDDSKNLFYDSNLFKQLDGLSQANALAFYLSNIQEIGSSGLEVTNIIVRDFCNASSKINTKTTQILINDDRVSSGFPEIDDVADVQQKIDDQQFLYKKTLHMFLDKLDFELSVKCLTCIIEEATDIGKNACPWPLLDAIITDYETKSIPFFDKQESIIKNKIDKIKEKLSFSKELNDYEEVLHLFETSVKDWDSVAQPIQVLYKSKGQEHKRSSKLASAIRNLALEAYNKYNFVDLSERVSNLLSEVFAEVPLVAETIADDIAFLTTTGRDMNELCELKRIIKRYDRDSLSKVSFSIGADAVDNIFDCIMVSKPLIINMSNKSVGRNYLASFILNYIVKYVNSTRDYSTGIKLIEAIEPLIVDKKLYMKFIENKVVLQHNNRFQESHDKDETGKASARILAITTAGFGASGAVLGLLVSDKSAFVGLALGVAIGLFVWLLIKIRDKKENTEYEERINESLKRVSHAISILASDNLLKCDSSLFESNSCNSIHHINMLKAQTKPQPKNRTKWVLAFLTIIGIGVGLYFFLNSEYWAWFFASKSATLESYRNYLMEFPRGQHHEQVEKRITDIRNRRLKILSITPFSSDEIKRFQKDFPEYNLSDIDNLFFEDAKRVNDISYYNAYLDAFPNGKYIMHVKASIKNAEKDLWENLKNSKNEKELRALLEIIQSKEIRAQIQQYISSLYRDFSYVSQINTIEAYEQFINLCPDSPDCSKARKRIIDIEVSKISQGQHGTIPESRPVSFSSGSTATIEIENKTQYTITVRYSGPDSIKIDIPSYGTKTIIVPIGSYRIAVSTNGGNVHPFYGTNNITAGMYSESFYIQSYQTYRRR